MIEQKSEKIQSLLIAGITPYFLERDVLWFSEHAEEIRQRANADSWWRTNTAFIAAEEEIPFSPFLRKLAGMGYVKTGRVERHGEFAIRGGIVDIFPVNLEFPVRIEFSTNRIEAIIPQSLAAAGRPASGRVSPPGRPAPAKIKDPTEYERLWLSDLRPGEYVVHLDHGVGIFRGITEDTMTMTDDHDIARHSHSQYFVLEYAPPRKGGSPDRLLVPRDKSLKLSRYVGFETPTIHRLGGTAWESAKRRARAGALELARELLETYKNRAQARRDPYPRYPDIEAELAHSFPYEETPDQARALAEIHDDLSKPEPMDRLLLGDVGFGKTELALRAAARVAYSGKQALFLVPTTILADQHLQTLRGRLKDLPFRTEGMTRLTPKRDQKKIAAGIAAGTVEIVVGTHRVLSKDVRWKNLGLVVIDEEQRFGVRAKERFKELRAEVDVLSLSATPIPRTLSLALSKFRNLSIIQSPPAGRQPIETFIVPFSWKIIREAVENEIKRSGQIFYLWNKIQNIELIKRRLEKLLPRVKIAILHGRAREKELLRIMHGFRARAYDMLLATTIIENGIDLPNVNTLIVANASRLGLAQAYQIRGRIGRGAEKGYAHFLYPAKGMTEKAKMRLAALEETRGLGAGFQIALRDMEIRGAGNVLGKEQSGTVNKVGLNLYAHLLNEAIQELNESPTE